MAKVSIPYVFVKFSFVQTKKLGWSKYWNNSGDFTAWNILSESMTIQFNVRTEVTRALLRKLDNVSLLWKSSSVTHRLSWLSGVLGLYLWSLYPVKPTMVSYQIVRSLSQEFQLNLRFWSSKAMNMYNITLRNPNVKCLRACWPRFMSNILESNSDMSNCALEFFELPDSF